MAQWTRKVDKSLKRMTYILECLEPVSPTKLSASVQGNFVLPYSLTVQPASIEQ